jgi:hypothetical protein
MFLRDRLISPIKLGTDHIERVFYLCHERVASGVGTCFDEQDAEVGEGLLEAGGEHGSSYATACYYVVV